MSASNAPQDPMLFLQRATHDATPGAAVSSGPWTWPFFPPTNNEATEDIYSVSGRRLIRRCTEVTRGRPVHKSQGGRDQEALPQLRARHAGGQDEGPLGQREESGRHSRQQLGKRQHHTLDQMPIGLGIVAALLVTLYIMLVACLLEQELQLQLII